MKDLSNLCIHTITTKPWAIEIAAEKYASAGVGGITVWRDALTGRNVIETGEMLRKHELQIISLCRGGFFPAATVEKRELAIEENKRAIEEAAALGAPLLVMVCGAEPSISLEESRKQIRDGILTLLPFAEQHKVKLAIEPLHPMYADTRSAINTLSQANDMAEYFNSDWVGVAIDVYHVWWDAHLQSEIIRCGEKGNIFAFHICDWKMPTKDLLNDRGLMGEGCIPIKQISDWVHEASFREFQEVEIFSNEYWQSDQDEYLKKIIEAYRNC